LFRRIYETLTEVEYADHSNEYFPSCPLCYSGRAHRDDCPLAQIFAEPAFQALIEEIAAERRAAPRHRALKIKSEKCLRR
jgi:hypothetical protein